MNVLAINAGSSSLKLASFTVDAARGELACTWKRTVDDVRDHAAALHEATAEIAAPEAVGHRLVHGGPSHSGPVRITAAVRRELDALVPLAPLHLPSELALIDAASARWPSAPQVACFDTAFHRTLPELAERFPLPRELFDRGVRRYGFHGLSYEHVVDTVGAATLGRAVIAHLGNGASMAAVRGGRSIDTTMGFTPTGGLMMGTRAGDLDPGVVLHVLAQPGMTPAALSTLLDHESGLRGVSGTTSDMKALLAASADDPRAELAIAMFCYGAQKTIGAYAAALGGLDTLVFTGGIGERAAPVRARICGPLEHLGVLLDDAKNARGDARISADASRCTVLVVHADEERTIARRTESTLTDRR